MAIVQRAVYKDGSTVVVVFAGTTFGLRNQAWLAALKLVNVHSAARDVVEATLYGFSTLVGLPSLAMGLAHDATEALG